MSELPKIDGRECYVFQAERGWYICDKDYSEEGEAYLQCDGRWHGCINTESYHHSKAAAEAFIAQHADKPTTCDVTETLCKELRERSAKGIAKYGTSLDRDDLTPEEWLEHGKQESLDHAGYCEAGKRAIGRLREQLASLLTELTKSRDDAAALRRELMKCLEKPVVIVGDGKSLVGHYWIEREDGSITSGELAPCAVSLIGRRYIEATPPTFPPREPEPVWPDAPKWGKAKRKNIDGTKSLVLFSRDESGLVVTNDGGDFDIWDCRKEFLETFDIVEEPA